MYDIKQPYEAAVHISFGKGEVLAYLCFCTFKNLPYLIPNILWYCIHPVISVIFFFLSSKYNRILWIFSPFYNWFFSLFFSSGTTIIAMETKAGAAVAEAMVVATTQVGEVTARVVMAVEVEEVGVVDTVVTSKISVLMFNHQILLCVFFFLITKKKYALYSL